MMDALNLELFRIWNGQSLNEHPAKPDLSGC